MVALTRESNRQSLRNDSIREQARLDRLLASLIKREIKDEGNIPTADVGNRVTNPTGDRR